MPAPIVIKLSWLMRRESWDVSQFELKLSSKDALQQLFSNISEVTAACTLACWFASRDFTNEDSFLKIYGDF